MAQTAVNWLIDQISSKENQEKLTGREWLEVVEKAKEMEKEQIIEAHNNGKFVLPPNENGEQYYNETYGKE